MKVQQKKKLAYSLAAICIALSVASLFWTFREEPIEIREALRVSELQKTRELIAEHLEPAILQGEFPRQIEAPLAEGDDPQLLELDYTIDPALQKSADKLLKSYKPDYGAVVMMDAGTGRILAMSSYQKKGEEQMNLALRGTFPAASIFKIVTAAAALDKYNVQPDTQLLFNGGNHTLYKRNVMSDKINRWTQRMSLRAAFARSVNTAFGRLSLETLVPQDLEDYAVRFGFNADIHSDLPFEQGVTTIPKEKNYHLAEMASGFNKVTRMSPIQGAMIAAAVAEDGVMKVPFVVERARDSDGKVVYQAEPLTAAVTMSPRGADKLKELMEATITQGTSKKSFRSLVRDRKFRELVVGGKTGSLTGDNPRGKVDWFVGYAMNENQKIAIAALTVNVEYWTVKSSYLAQSMFRSHFKDQFSKANERFFSSSNADPGL